ncbi:hypothetical protein MMAG44476_23769 [Mycolicibacterium mageritense DSM 44476 = CIP 104973]|uniref:Secreted protein n=1 Tax=Mycolicibacterium mageritense TaxID=53462 RepID=A0ABM7HVG4_MYCME|nr:hypothetical protein [Mycolicibacterium mageritense]MCC9179344.1 hypothetical protein [Mycolicibacterium mageritense]BBX34595.1 hypothetical protein MMAGJ_38770 [Mycolicibacterium mageritense]CDO20885.1 hypothetical protein BN978_01343 [Mycolicibacterium mageritense DSM 44476 = CIP 104973]
MNRTLIAGLALAAVLSLGWGPAVGTAHADNLGPYQWCPGQDMAFSPQTGSTGPGREFVWDMNVCHTFWFVDYGKGNVARNYPPPPESNVWDGDNPPPSTRCFPWCL